MPDVEHDDEPEYVPLRHRREKRAAEIARLNGQSDGLEARARSHVVSREDVGKPGPHEAGPASKRSLLDQAYELKKKAEGEQKTEEEKIAEEEAEIMAGLAEHKAALKAVAEVAKDVQYDKPLESSWQPPRWLTDRGQQYYDKVRSRLGILVEGENVPPPCETFRAMKFPRCIIDGMKNKGIRKPSLIQIQGLPVAMSGRDMIGVAFTGSGKTLSFVLPAIMRSWELEEQLPISSGEGPSALLMCPSRELARQTFEIVQHFAKYVHRRGGGPELRSMLTIGGIDGREQNESVARGVHICVATPGRLLDSLRRKKFNLEACQYICLDEADRLIDMGFEEDIRSIFDFFSAQRQTVMYSATMPTKIQNFASSALVQPIVVNVGRAGAANMDVVQEVEFVRQEAKIVYLLDCLQKTPPPVLIFCESKNDVDDIHEYLLLKGVDGCSIHGAKDQEERETAMREFRAGEKDVLVATDIAAKGIDFPAIQHVINFDMPKEIENYIHRIGRTGRSGKTGVATTFINSSSSPSVLLDLKYVLLEAKQRIPEALENLEDDNELAATSVGGIRGCAFCGGLGHRVTGCPKLESEKMKALIGQTSGGASGGDRFMADRGGTRGYGGDW